MSRAEPPLPVEVLARRTQLPVKPEPVTLVGPRILLEPVREEDFGPLHRVSDGSPVIVGAFGCDQYDPDERVWRWMPYGPFHRERELRDEMERLAAAPDLRMLCVREHSTGHPAGLFCLMSNSPAHLRIELGHIWFGAPFQGYGFAREAALLALGHCFALGYRRVEWKCDARNDRSRAAAAAVGFRFEGIQEQHMIKERSRDTAWYRILAEEWPGLLRRREGPS